MINLNARVKAVIDGSTHPITIRTLINKLKTDTVIKLIDTNNKATIIRSISDPMSVDCVNITLANAVTISLSEHSTLRMMIGTKRSNHIVSNDIIHSYTCGCGAVGGLTVTTTSLGTADCVELTTATGSFQLANGASIIGVRNEQT